MHLPMSRWKKLSFLRLIVEENNWTSKLALCCPSLLSGQRPQMAICISAAGPVLLTVNNTSQEKGKNLTRQEAICSHLFATSLWVCCSNISIFFCNDCPKKIINFLSFHYIICGHAVGSSESSKCPTCMLSYKVATTCFLLLERIVLP